MQLLRRVPIVAVQGDEPGVVQHQERYTRNAPRLADISI